MTQTRPLPTNSNDDGRRGRWLVIGLVTAALALAFLASLYRNEAGHRRPTTVPDGREGQVLQSPAAPISGS